MEASGLHERSVHTPRCERRVAAASSSAGFDRKCTKHACSRSVTSGTCTHNNYMLLTGVPQAKQTFCSTSSSPLMQWHWPAWPKEA